MIPLEVKVLASGSKGNCIYVGSGDSHVLIDVGVAKTKVEKVLLENGIDPTKLDAIFITHAHKDHVQGLPLAQKYLIPIYASEGEWKSIPSVPPEERQVIRKIDGHYSMIELGDLHVYPFGTHHDAFEPLGYAVEDDIGNRCCIVLDTGHIDNEMLEMMEGNILIIEANHEESMVEVSDYPDSVKARILSDIGHLSNQQCAEALAKLVQGKGERIMLTHLSSNNNDRDLAAMTVSTALRKKGFKDGEHYFLEVV